MTLDYYERIERFAKLVLVDPRGTGQSDPLPSTGVTTESATADLVAVLDDAGIDRATLWGFHSGGLIAISTAATHPGRVERLILSNTWARMLRADDQPWGITKEFSDRLIDEHSRRIGEGAMFADAYAPSRRGDAQVAAWFSDIEAGLSRSQAVALTRWAQESDVRDLLPRIVAPTLVVHTAGNRAIEVAHARYLATSIPGAQLVEVPSIDHVFPITEVRDAIVDEVEGFVTGVRPLGRGSRTFAVVLFTDIVGSTRRAAEMGDGSWRLALADHDRVTCEAIERHGGQLVKSTGDGVLALFETPSDAVRAARKLVDELARSTTPVRVGIHAGELERRDDDVAGIAVHVAQRVCSAADEGEIWVSRGFPDLVLGSDLVFVDRGEHELKGRDVPMQLWSIA
jgi:class 3 adenylate cyclase/pimeloyl-ACP methyl ester carboxylesterase